MGVWRVSTDILSRNHRKSDFVWGINSQAPAIRRISNQVVTFKGMTVTKAGSQVLTPECLVRTVLTQHHERWEHSVGERLLSNLKQRYQMHMLKHVMFVKGIIELIAGQLKCLYIL